jgi:hypothetical protein
MIELICMKCRNRNVEGKCDDFIRTFLKLPNGPLNHSQGGPSTDDFDKANKICNRCKNFSQ